MKRIIKILIGIVIALHIVPLGMIGIVMLTGEMQGHSYLFYYVAGLITDVVIIGLFVILGFILWCFDFIDL